MTSTPIEAVPVPGTALPPRRRRAFSFARFSNSLAAKLFIVVFVVLLLSFGALGYANVRLHRRHLEAARRSNAQRMSDIVRRSTSYYMLRNDREALRHIVGTIGKEPGITRLRITDQRGQVAFSAGRAARGERVITIKTPILNTPSCSSGDCHAHPLTQRVLGNLDVSFSLAEADAEVEKASFQFVTYSAFGILITLGAIGILVLHFVHEPVHQLRVGTVRLGAGDLGVQIPVRANDELGELAASFNAMSRQLRDAREESNALAQALENRVARKTAELRHAQQQMIQAEKLTSLGKLAAVVAHEINNPLSGILAYAKLLRKWIERGDSLEMRAPEMRDSLQLIENESRRCGDIVRSLLTFARVQPMNVTDFDVNKIIRRTIQLVAPKLDLGNIVPHLELAENLPPIRGDAGQIEQLLLAIIMNAIEAMPREGNLHVMTSASEDRSSIVITIADNGMGIPPDILPHLFEPFTTTKEEGKGVGLGLAISQSIVDRHAGRIEGNSEVGKGTTFTITLPCGTESDPDMTGAEPAAARLFQETR